MERDTGFRFEGNRKDAEAVQKAWLSHVPESIRQGDLKNSSLNRALQLANKLDDKKLSKAICDIAAALLCAQKLSSNKDEDGWECVPNTFKNRDDLGAAIVVALEKGHARALDVASGNIRTAFSSDEAVTSALKELETAVKSRIPTPREPAPRGKHKIRFG